MKHGFFRTAAAVTAAVFLCLPARAANFSGSVSARSAILVDAQTGRVLYEKNADEQSLIASTTKIMTGLLVCEAGELEREISVPPEAAGVEGSSLYLKAGERITVRELLYGLMLRSRKRRGGGARDCNRGKHGSICRAHERESAGAGAYQYAF